MPRLSIPESIEAAPSASRLVLEEIEKRRGSLSNLTRLMANSPAALEGYLDMSDALGKGDLPAATRERIALALSEFHNCNYCLSAHVFHARKQVRLDDAEITANRSGASNDIQAEAAVCFALALARTRGQVSTQQIDAIKAAGYDDAQIVEIVQQVALTTFTNYLSGVAAAEIDFPLVQSRPTR